MVDAIGLETDFTLETNRKRVKVENLDKGNESVRSPRPVLRGTSGYFWGYIILRVFLAVYLEVFFVVSWGCFSEVFVVVLSGYFSGISRGISRVLDSNNAFQSIAFLVFHPN